MGDWIIKMKQHIGGEVVTSDFYKVFVMGAVNNWEAPIKQFRVCDGYSIEFLDRDLLLRVGRKGELEFIDYSQTGCSLPPDIEGLHIYNIRAIQRIAKNIMVTASDDGYIKVIDPISRKCYLKFKKGNKWWTITYFY